MNTATRSCGCIPEAEVAAGQETPSKALTIPSPEPGQYILYVTTTGTVASVCVDTNNIEVTEYTPDQAREYGHRLIDAADGAEEQ